MYQQNLSRDAQHLGIKIEMKFPIRRFHYYKNFIKLQDIAAGLLLAMTIMIPVMPIVDILDSTILTNYWSPLFVLVISILVIVYYPNSGKWTPTRLAYSKCDFD